VATKIARCEKLTPTGSMWTITWNVAGQTAVEADDAEQALELFRALGAGVLEDGDDPAVMAVELGC